MSPRIPGTPPLKHRILESVTRCQGLIAADYARRLNLNYQTTAAALQAMAKAGALRKAPIENVDSPHHGKQGYFLPL